MSQAETVAGVLIDDAALSLEELARACEVEPDWVVQRVRAGIIAGDPAVEIDRWRFTSVELGRARRIARIERDFDANEDLAALVVDLADEVRRLKARLRLFGLE